MCCEFKPKDPATYAASINTLLGHHLPPGVHPGRVPNAVHSPTGPDGCGVAPFMPRARDRGLQGGRLVGYTPGMKTAVSVPDEVFEGAERLARRTRRSRSRLYSDALREYVARHAAEEVTAAMNRVLEEVGELQDPFVSTAARRVLERSEW